MKKSARNKKITNSADIPERPKIVAEIEPKVEKNKSMKRLFSNKPVVIGVVIILMIIIAAGVIYAISYYVEDAEFKQTPEDTQKILSELGKVYVLPEDETPTVATVTDIEKLSSQPFFAKAQNGDKVILFGGIKQAILYRPSIKKIVNMSPIDPNSIPQAEETTATPSASNDVNVSPTPKEKIKVAVMNSTKEVGLARKGGELLDEDVFDVVSTLNANGEYTGTTISKVNGATVSDADLSTLSSSLTGIKPQIGSLPTDEAAPAGVDVVIVLGSDFSEAH